jgi:hypothetical protein
VIKFPALIYYLFAGKTPLDSLLLRLSGRTCPTDKISLVRDLSEILEEVAESEQEKDLVLSSHLAGLPGDGVET